MSGRLATDQLRQAEIEKHDMWQKGFCRFDRFYSIESHPHFMARQFHQDCERFCGIQIVIDNENFTPRSRRMNGQFIQGSGLRSLD